MANQARAVCVLLLLSASACGDKNSAAPEVRGTQVSLVGRVYSADEGKAVMGVKLVDGAGASAETDADGRFEMKREGAPSKLSIDGKGHAEGHRSLPKEDAYVDISIKEVDQVKEFDSAEGAVLDAKTGAKVEIKGDSLVTAAQRKPNGRVTAQLTSVDPKSPAHLAALPGEGKARSGKTEGQLGVLGALDLSAKDEDGSALTAAEGKPVLAEFPAGAESKQEVDLFSFEEKTGEWKKEGSATLDEKKRVYRAKFPHLSWWAIGEFIDTLSCVRACVNGSDGEPAAFAGITVTGVDYATVLSTFADEKGCFALDVKAGSQVSVRAVTKDGESESELVSVSQTQRSAADDAQACQDLGTLTIAMSSGASCPVGFASCSGTCLDLSRDGQNCGECGATCEAQAMCVAGACDTAPAMADAGLAPACPLGAWATNTPADGSCDGAVGTVTFTLVDEGGGRLSVTQDLANIPVGPGMCSAQAKGTATYEGNTLTLHFPDELNGCTQDLVQVYTVDASCATISTNGDTTITNCGSCDQQNQCAGCGTESCTNNGGEGTLMRVVAP